MSGKTALITGIAGQDGSYLAELLLSKGYYVHGLVRRNSVPEYQTGRLDRLLSQLTLHYGDMTDPVSLESVMSTVIPDEVYNLAGQSHVRVSSDIPFFTGQTNAIGVLSILEAVKRFAPKARFYQASSSEMFGSAVDPDGCQRETTAMLPVSPYGIAKLYGYHCVRHYRRGHDLFATNGILFNHESPRRGSNFVTAKVIKTAVEISLGRATELRMGNLDSRRDWGHSRDYVRAMWMMLQHHEADDFVVATGETRSVRELCERVFSRLNLDYQDYVVQDARFMRPQELPYLKGDSSKVRRVLGWEPETTFNELIDEMVDHWKARYASHSLRGVSGPDCAHDLPPNGDHR